MAIIKPNNNTISAITALPAAIPNGKVLQVVHKNLTSDLSTNSTSYQDLDSQVFTPTSSSSKVFIMTTNHIFLGGSNAANYRGAQIKILRDSTTIANDGKKTSKYGSSYHLSDADDRLFLFHTIQLYDNPNTASEVTYKIQYASHNGRSTIYVNNNSYSEIRGKLTLMEVAG